MSGTVRCGSLSGYYAAPGQLGLALAVSAVIHALIAVALVPGVPWRGAASTTAHLITARLEPVDESPKRDPLGLPAGAIEIPRTASAEDGSNAPSERATERQRQGATTPHQTPDLTYYSARDLDSYPMPLAMLGTDRLTGAGSGEARLILLIDENGIVREVVFEEPAVASPVREALSTAFAATPFIPARKDGRAVRSRIVLSVNLGPQGSDH